MSTLKWITGNIFESKAEALVCPVNCCNTLGAGLAKAFRDNPKYKQSNEAYKQACLKGEMAPGSVMLGVNGFEPNEGWVFYLATKMHWSDYSKVEWIENGLFNLLRACNHYKIKSLALPLIGTGLGGLAEASVEIVIKEVFEKDGNKDRIIEVYRYQ
jgi:O-acetyl-ADP-ribose deacetylase (regulator of RNase III)